MVNLLKFSLLYTNEIFILIRSGQTDVFPILIGNGAEVDAKNSDGKTPLFTAAEYGNRLNFTKKQKT